MVKNLPAMQETWVQSQVWEDPLKKEMENPLQYSMDGGAWGGLQPGVGYSLG